MCLCLCRDDCNHFICKQILNKHKKRAGKIPALLCLKTFDFYSKGAPVNIGSLALIVAVSPNLSASVLPKYLGNSEPR